MSPGEKYDLRRKNFIFKAQAMFIFLVLEFSFDEPEHEFYKENNGTVISDSIIYKSERCVIKFKNAYHPIDYGFELIVESKRYLEPKIIFWKLKEEQDLEQVYLEEAVPILKNQIRKFIA